MSLLIALTVVLTQFLAVTTPIVRISVAFVPLTLMGMLFGPFWAGIGSVLADILGMILFPKGAFFWGFTLNAWLRGVLYGKAYYQKKRTWSRVLVTTLIDRVGISLLLTPIWLKMMGVETGLSTLITIRLVENAIFFPIQVILTYYMSNYFSRYGWLETQKR